MQVNSSKTLNKYFAVTVVFAFIISCLNVSGWSQTKSPNPFAALKEIPPPATVPGSISLPVQGATQEYPQPESWLDFGGSPVVRNVSRPTLTPVIPPAGKGTGAAVVIAPGGGFFFLTMNKEGFDVASFLASQGIAAFVLKYRLVPSPQTSEFGQFVIGQLSQKDVLNSQWFTSAKKIAAQDAQEAMRMVRSRSAEWGVDPKRVGIIGFSAGAFAAIELLNATDPSTIPNFVGYIYGGMNAPTVPATLPPLFAAVAADDALWAASDFGIVRTWQAAKAPMELHVFDRGGHGWGLPGTPGSTNVHWADEFVWWLRSHDWLQPTTPAATSGPKRAN